jgi:hypothetical protein
MEGQEVNYSNQYGTPNTSLSDVEEKQRILKDRLLLIGENLVEIKEQTTQDLLEIKKEVTSLKQNMVRLIKFLETASTEMTKFAKKEDLELLAKQIKMMR